METMMTLLILRLVVEIQIGFLNAEVIPELSRYETEDWVRSGPRHVMSSQISEVRKYISPHARYKWDTIQSEFMCCGGYGHHQVTRI